MPTNASRLFKAGYFTSLNSFFLLLSHAGMPGGAAIAMVMLGPVALNFFQLSRRDGPWPLVFVLWFLALAHHTWMTGEYGIPNAMVMFSLIYHPALMFGLSAFSNHMELKHDREKIKARVDNIDEQLAEIVRQTAKLREQNQQTYARMSAAERAIYLEMLSRLAGTYRTPHAPQRPALDWRKVLGIGPEVDSMTEVTKAYRAKAMELHQAGQGDGPMMVQLNLARDEAKMRIG